MNRLLLLLAVIITLTSSAGAVAQERETTGASHEEEPHHVNTIGVFGGVTVKRAEPGAGTLALEYVRKFRHENRRRPFWVGAAVVFGFTLEYSF